MKIGDTVALGRKHRLINLCNEHMVVAYEKGLYDRAARMQDHEADRQWFKLSIEEARKGFMLIHPDLIL